jgi:flagellar biosynthesis/type III secretory pathway protein FliH
MILQANMPGVKELTEMSGAALEKVMRECGFIDKWKTEGWEEGRAEGREEAAAEYAKQLRQVNEQIRRLQEENRRLREGRQTGRR